KEPPMKDTARSRTRRQEAPHIGQLALAAMLDARASLYSTIVRTGMKVVSAMMEDDRVRLLRAALRARRETSRASRRARQRRACARWSPRSRSTAARPQRRRRGRAADLGAVRVRGSVE